MVMRSAANIPGKIVVQLRRIPMYRQKTAFLGPVQAISPDQELVSPAVQTISPEKMVVRAAIQARSPPQMPVSPSIQTISPWRMGFPGLGGVLSVAEGGSTAPEVDCGGRLPQVYWRETMATELGRMEQEI